MNYRQSPIYNVIQKIKETDGTNAKIEILTQAVEQTPYMKEFLKAVYNPHIQYHIKKIPDYRPHRAITGDFYISKLFKRDMLRPLYERQKTGQAAIDYLVYLLESLPAEDAKALELIIERSADCGLSVKSINKVVPGLIPEFPCMLCSAYSEKLVENFSYPAYSQVKMDGLRGIVVNRNGDISTFSRNGKPLALDDVFKGLGKKGDAYVLDGEVLVIDDDGSYLPRKTSNGIINKVKKGNATAEEMDRIRYVVWDIIPLAVFEGSETFDDPYETRYNALCQMVDRLPTERVSVVETVVVASYKEAQEHFAQSVAAGNEGTVLKEADSVWINGRPKTQIKFKLEKECDLFIREVVEGKGKYRGKVGALVCESSDGKLRVSVGSGLSDAEREELWEDSPVGKVIAVKYNEKIMSDIGFWSLFLPRSMGVRFDKTEADSFAEIG